MKLQDLYKYEQDGYEHEEAEHEEAEHERTDVAHYDRGEYDREGDMALTQLHTICTASQDLLDMVHPEDNLPEWVQAKLTLAQDYMTTVRDYLMATTAQVTNEAWDDSGASDAKGRWADYRDGKIGVGAMAKWLLSSRVHKKTKEEKLKSAYGAIAQQQNTSKLITAKQADALRSALDRL